MRGRTTTPRAPALALLAATLAFVCCGCGDGDRERDDGPAVRVVATTGMVAELARMIGGDRVSVTGLMGPGVDPHLYKASEGDVRRLQEADLVLYNGLHLEARMGEVLEKMDRWVPTVAVAACLPADTLLAPAEFRGSPDPHVWFDVGLWAASTPCVENALAEADPAGAAVYAANAERCRETLAALDAYVRERAAAIPAESRVLVTAHDAFNYFGRAYGFEVLGLQGISTAAEAGTADVAALAATIARRRIPAIFVESSVSPRAIEAVQAAVRARGFAVGIGGRIYSDALGTAGTPAGDYVGMVRHNIDTIAAALAPEAEAAAGS